MQIFFDILYKTSRSFAIGIDALKSPLREEICLCYLLCRLFDIYEDSNSVDPHLRKYALEGNSELLNLLTVALPKDISSKWKKMHPENLNWECNQLALIDLGPKLWEVLYQLPINRRKIITLYLSDMIVCMQREISRQIDNDLSVRTLSDVDAYCYGVAGTVGLLLMHFFKLEKGISSGISNLVLESLAISFGKALQLINILKDFHQDWQEGRCFWPEISQPKYGSGLPPLPELQKSKKKISDLFYSYAEDAQRFICYLDRVKRPDIHFFCKFPLEMALATMKEGERDLSWLTRGGTFKVSRELVEHLVLDNSS